MVTSDNRYHFDVSNLYNRVIVQRHQIIGQISSLQSNTRDGVDYHLPINQSEIMEALVIIRFRKCQTALKFDGNIHS